MPTVRENLIAAKALIDTPEKWIKGTFGGNGCYCAIGAVKTALDGQNGSEDAIERLTGTVPDFNKLPEARHYRLLAQYNDHPDTTHADIMALFDRAISAAP